MNYELTEVPDKKEAQEFWGSIWEKENSTGKIPNGLKISRGTLKRKKNKKK